MKLEFIKQPGGTLVPASEITVEKLKRIKNNSYMTADVVQPRNYEFHKKAMALINKAFEYWCADKTDKKYMSNATQFEEFRKDLTILAGYYDQVFDLNGNMKLVAKSWKFSDMDQEKFEQFYTALWNAIAANVVRFEKSDHWMMGF